MAVLCMEWFMANLLVCELLKAFVRTDYVSTKASVDEPSLPGLQWQSLLATVYSLVM